MVFRLYRKLLSFEVAARELAQDIFHLQNRIRQCLQRQNLSDFPAFFRPSVRIRNRCMRSLDAYCTFSVPVTEPG